MDHARTFLSQLERATPTESAEGNDLLWVARGPLIPAASRFSRRPRSRDRWDRLVSSPRRIKSMTSREGEGTAAAAAVATVVARRSHLLRFRKGSGSGTNSALLHQPARDRAFHRVSPLAHLAGSGGAPSRVSRGSLGSLFLSRALFDLVRVPFLSYDRPSRVQPRQTCSKISSTIPFSENSFERKFSSSSVEKSYRRPSVGS